MKKAEKYNNSILDSIMDEIEVGSYELVENQMMLAAKIKSRMNKMGISNSKLAELCKKQNSVITKWLSGTHNFTTETLFQIQKVLDFTLVNNNNIDELIKPDYSVKISVKAGQTSTTHSSFYTQTTINEFPV